MIKFNGKGIGVMVIEDSPSLSQPVILILACILTLLITLLCNKPAWRLPSLFVVQTPQFYIEHVFGKPSST